jgi:Na+-driven multidrug efflux pump
MWCYIFIERLDMGIDGAALAKVCTEFVNIVVMFSIMGVPSTQIPNYPRSPTVALRY